MWFSLFGLILVLCITFFQGLQGLFSAFIMCVLTILCAALAFGSFETVYHGFLIKTMPEYGEAVALVSIFILSLLVLRTVLDNVIKGNMVIPVWADRAGGGVLGFVSAILIVGVLQLGFELLPFSEQFLGYNRFVAVNAERRDKELDEDELKDVVAASVAWRRNDLLLNPDGFAARVASMLSSGSLSGSTHFASVYPDFPAWAQNTRTVVQRESRHTVSDPEAMSVFPDGYAVLGDAGLIQPGRKAPDQLGNTPYTEVRRTAEPGKEFRCYRVFLAEEARDTDRRIRFRAPQVRIVGNERAGGPPAEYLLTGIQREARPTEHIELLRAIVLDKPEFCDVNRQSTGPKDPLDFVFEVPVSFQANFIEFKRTARVDVSRIRLLPEGERLEPLTGRGGGNSVDPIDRSGEQSSSGQPRDPNAGPPDRVGGVWTKGAPAFAADAAFPAKLGKYDLTGGEVVRNKLTGGNVVAQITEDSDQGSQVIEFFDVPPGEHLLYVPVTQLDPKSYLGRALGYARETLPSHTLKLADGTEHRPVGRFAIAKIQGQWWLECRYLDEFARTSESALPRFEKLQRQHLTQDDTTLVYLFLVPSGGRPKEIVRAGKDSIDLSKFDVVAPE